MKKTTPELLALKKELDDLQVEIEKLITKSKKLKNKLQKACPHSSKNRYMVYEEAWVECKLCGEIL